MAVPVHEIDEYLRVQTRKINAQFSNMKDASALYDDYYENIKNDDLKQVFPLFHAMLNNLFSFMNQKLSPGYGGHFNADPSRELIDVIEAFQKLQTNLKNSPIAFDLDPYYVELIGRCSAFLSKSGGSTIPSDFPMIELIEHRAIFIMMNVVEVKRLFNKEVFQTKLIGGGSYAQVFKYKDPYYNRWFALKRAKTNLTAKELQRFKNEYETTRKFNSPYIIEAYNYNDEKHEHTLEYANGGTLADYIRDNNTKLDMQDRLKLIGQLFNAFIYIHEKEILHRDISYHNILIHHFDQTWTVLKIADFGLVKIPKSSLTSIDSSVKGSLNDPDLTKVGFVNYEVRHEIYALTQVVNFLFCGKKHGNGLYGKSQAVKEFLLKGLAANIDERFISVEEMVNAFQSVKHELLKL
ncbi:MULTISPECIES: protein kinase domain-containing protein [Paenibacillus]|uniref:protein kinase domain-containing protein n=1 Tax=Paenibacillus TaxID=44249 RepID=UPI00042092C3|nr:MULTISPECIES: protein kinase family protein [Paenibacillus]UMY54868.1 protein kinase [Paenibacillus peoriae]